MPLFESGALRGDRPEEAFYVRCDDAVNPPEAVAAGRLVMRGGRRRSPRRRSSSSSGSAGARASIEVAE